MRKRLITAAVSLGIIAVFGFAGCSSSASFTQLLGDAKVELDGLNGTVEGDFNLPYTDIAMNVELESGTVDVDVVDILVSSDDDSDDAIELDTISESRNLSSGGGAIFSDGDGDIRVRVTSNDGATGTIQFLEAE